MHNDLQTVRIELPLSNDPAKRQEVQAYMDHMQDSMDAYCVKVAKELNISEGFAMEIVYLRGRSRWTPELEQRLLEANRRFPNTAFHIGTGEESEVLASLGI